MSPEWTEQYETAISLLKCIQNDYRLAQKELQDVSLRFAEREAEAGRRLRAVLDALDKINTTPRVEAQGNSPTLEVYCLGKFQVQVDGKRIGHWRSVKAESILRYLVGQPGHRASKDMLMEALWPACELGLANNNLKAAVRVLRQTLNFDHNTDGGFAWVLFQGGNYVLNPEAAAWVDVEQFEYHLHAGRRLDERNKVEEAISEYKAADVLYRGEFLENNLYEEWTWLRREALKDKYLTIVGKLADYSMEKADYEGCIIYCQKILNKDSCREDAYRRLMFCYSRLGQRNRAMGWYRICEKIIKSELDVCPDQRTVALYKELLNGDAIELPKTLKDSLPCSQFSQISHKIA